MDDFVDDSVDIHERDFVHVNAAITNIAAALAATYFVGEDVHFTPKAPPFSFDMFATFGHVAHIVMPGSTLGLICTANITSKAFWEYVSERLELDEQIRPVNDVLLLEMSSVKLLHSFNLPKYRSTKFLFFYQPFPKRYSVDRMTHKRHLLNLKIDDPLHRVVETDLLLRGAYKDQSDAGKRRFRKDFLRFYRWAENCGLVSERLAMLTVECLFVMFAQTITELLRSATQHGHTEVTQYKPDQDYLCELFRSGALHEFFSTGHPRDGDMKRLMIELPANHHNAAASISSEAARCFKAAIEDVCRPLWRGEPFKLIEDAGEGFQNFLDNTSHMICITARCWDIKLRGQFLDHMPEILVQFQTQFRESNKGLYQARLWPHMLPSNVNGFMGDCVYLADIHRVGIGMDKTDFEEEGYKDKLMVDLDQIFGSLEYNRQIMYLEFILTTPADVRESLYAKSSASSASSPSPPPLPQAEPQPPSAVDFVAILNPPSKKFRPFSSALSRLLWDPVHRGLQYEVGYVDRFPSAAADEDGLLWKPLDSWQRHTEEEDFVPEHRVRKIRRAADLDWSARLVVWDRDKRHDGT
jgi:uncharacterized protein (UPF0248 family)